MAISNYIVISSADWDLIKSGYIQITPVITGSGTSDPNLSVSWYVKNSDNTAFAIRISSSGAESLTLWNSTTADQLDLVCTSSAGSQGNIYHTLNESQGWSANFNVAMSITNTNSSKGTWTFTKGKGERPHL